MKPKPEKIEAILELDDSDVSTSFGTAGAGALTPPEVDYRTATFTLSIDDNLVNDLVSGLDEGYKIEDQNDIEVFVSEGRLRVRFSVIGKKPIGYTGASY